MMMMMITTSMAALLVMVACRDRAVAWRDDMLRTTYRNLYLLKRISETSSTYRRDKYLNDWVVSVVKLVVTQ